MKNNQVFRPNNFGFFVGQKKLKQILKVLIKSSEIQNKSIDHILLVSNPGCGKTTLASIIANEAKKEIKFIQGSQIEKKSDLLILFSNLKSGDIIFIDEFHSIDKNVEELLHSIMEDFVIDMTIGPEGEKRIIRMKLPPFTIIGATTKVEKITQPILDRFGLNYKLELYTSNDIKKIILNQLKLITFKIEEDALELLVKNTTKVPRVALNLTKKIIDFVIFKSEEKVIKKLNVLETFNFLGIYHLGLNDLQIQYLDLFNQNKMKSLSLDVLCSLLNQSRENIIYNVEPLLLTNDLITKTYSGRKMTEIGEKYLKRKNNYD